MKAITLATFALLLSGCSWGRDHGNGAYCPYPVHPWFLVFWIDGQKVPPIDLGNATFDTQSACQSEANRQNEQASYSIAWCVDKAPAPGPLNPHPIAPPGLRSSRARASITLRAAPTAELWATSAVPCTLPTTPTMEN